MMHTGSKKIMVPNLYSIIAVLLLGTPVLILIAFLPAIFELMKPKDCGPRMITDHVPEGLPESASVFCFANIEEDQRFVSPLSSPLKKILEFLPNLEP